MEPARRDCFDHVIVFNEAGVLILSKRVKRMRQTRRASSTSAWNQSNEE